MQPIKSWDELTIQDNFLFQKVMQNKRICKMLIEKLLHIKIKDITYPDAEKTIAMRIDSKSVRLDVYVQDEQGTVYDIEMQTTNGSDGELAKRTRYYQAMIDMDVLGKGKMYNELNQSYIIFICTFDLFGKGKPIYTFRNLCIEDKETELGDAATKMFLNSTSTGEGCDKDIRAFLRYVDGKAAEGKFVQAVDQTVRKVKEHPEMRREYMTLEMELRRTKQAGYEEGMKKGISQGISEGISQGVVNVALAMLEQKEDYELISRYTKLSIKAIQDLAQKQRLI